MVCRTSSASAALPVMLIGGTKDHAVMGFKDAAEFVGLRNDLVGFSNCELRTGCLLPV